MQIETVEALLKALQTSKLFTDEQLLVVLRELAPHGSSLPAVVKHLVDQKHLTVYQLKKVLHGKSSELILGPYIICSKLGEGGMGRVYRARHTRVGREVALKIVRPNLLANPIIRGRYEREIEAAGTLRHPNIVSVEDAGEFGGRYYMAMEFVDGVDLSRLVRDHRALPVSEACEYIRQAALGLQHAHEAGFVHRDIKPSNIIVAGERHLAHAKGPAHVKILDMGLVRPMGYDDVPGADELTRDGTVVGTPDYMSPEQAKNSSVVDGRADLYSLGCTLFFLLAGRPPFPDGSPIEKLLKHQLDPTPAIRDLRADVPDEVVNIITMLTAKKPADRLPSAAAVAQALAPMTLHTVGAHPIRLRYAHPIPQPETSPQVDRSGPIVPPPGSSGQVAVPQPQGTQALPFPHPSSGAVPVLPAEVPIAQPAQPVAPSDPTPRPIGLPGSLQQAVEAASPFERLGEPPTGPLPEIPPDQAEPRRKQPEKPTRTYLYIAAGVVACSLILLAIVLASRGKSTVRPDSSGGPGTPVETPPRPVARPTGIVPKVDFTRLHPAHTLIPDGAGLVVVTYPAAYFKEKDSPFLKGTGPGRLSQLASRIATETSLILSRTERAVISIPATDAGRFVMMTEGDFLTPDFARVLGSNPRLTHFPLLGKLDRPVRFYTAPGGRQTALILPTNGTPLYALASGLGTVDRLAPRLVNPFRNPPPPDLDPGMLLALETASENPTPLLLAVMGRSFTLPMGDNQQLKDFGIDLLTLRVRVGSQMEIELVAIGLDRDKVREGLKNLAATLREEDQSWTEPLAEILSRNGVGEMIPGGFRWTIRVAWSPEQFSVFLERCLTP